VSCQSWAGGYFTVYRHLAQDDLDLVVHLGDYIYEHGMPMIQVAVPRAHPPRRRDWSTIWAGYRLRYALTKTDPDLQLAHRRFPWLLTLDDHEVANG
jgi:alkaline phosphatase D